MKIYRPIQIQIQINAKVWIYKLIDKFTNLAHFFLFFLSLSLPLYNQRILCCVQGGGGASADACSFHFLLTFYIHNLLLSFLYLLLFLGAAREEKIVKCEKEAYSTRVNGYKNFKCKFSEDIGVQILQRIEMIEQFPFHSLIRQLRKSESEI